MCVLHLAGGHFPRAEVNERESVCGDERGRGRRARAVDVDVVAVVVVVALVLTVERDRRGGVPGHPPVDVVLA